MAKITINDLLEAGCHFGHQTRRWNPKMKPYVYGARNGISIIDLSKTMYQINDACNFLQRVVVNGGDILFVGTKRQAREIVAALAERTGMFHVSERWLGGTLTNNVTIRKSIAKMNALDATVNSEAAATMKKKELSLLARDAEKLHRNLDGIAGMKKLPAALVIIDVCHEINAVREANKLGIPIVALVDTNGDPSVISYPVAANDDAVKSIQIITDVFADAILIAKEVYQKRVVEEAAAKAAAEKLAADAVAEAEEAAEAAPKAAPKARKPRARKESDAEAEAKPEAPAEAEAKPVKAKAKAAKAETPAAEAEAKPAKAKAKAAKAEAKPAEAEAKAEEAPAEA